MGAVSAAGASDAALGGSGDALGASGDALGGSGLTGSGLGSVLRSSDACAIASVSLVRPDDSTGPAPMKTAADSGSG